MIVFDHGYEELRYTGRFDETGTAKIDLKSRKEYLDETPRWAGKEFVVSYRKKFKKRSNKLNRWYWGEAVPKAMIGLRNKGHVIASMADVDEVIAEFFTRINEDQTHEFLKNKFGNFEVYDPETGEVKWVKPSTTRMENLEFTNNYAETIIQWGRDFLGVDIKWPDERRDMD